VSHDQIGILDGRFVARSQDLSLSALPEVSDMPDLDEEAAPRSARLRQARISKHTVRWRAGAYPDPRAAIEAHRWIVGRFDFDDGYLAAIERGLANMHRRKWQQFSFGTEPGQGTQELIVHFQSGTGQIIALSDEDDAGLFVIR